MIVSEHSHSLGQGRQSAITRAMKHLLARRPPDPPPGGGWQSRCDRIRRMQPDELRAVQAPLKEQYRADPGAASITLRAAGTLDDGVSCSVQTGRALATAGLHPLTGGRGRPPPPRPPLP